MKRFNSGSEKMKWYRTTVRGHISDIYNHQKRNSLVRGHPMPSYSFEWLATKSENDPQYIEIHNEWVRNGCPKNLTPSYDRIDNGKPYTENNIQITTWKKNEQRSRDDMRSGIITHGHNPQKVVYKHDLFGKFICKYHSMQEASRQTGIPASNICKNCQGERASAGGFIWSYYEFL